LDRLSGKTQIQAQLEIMHVLLKFAEDWVLTNKCACKFDIE
jgi:hypothetical protein